MENTIAEMDIELEPKDNKRQTLEKKKLIPGSKTVEEMNRLDSNKRSSKDKCDRIMIRLNKTLIFHKYIKN